MATNTLYYGDNVDILPRYIKDESVDLIYLDPPFKSNQDYNVLFEEQNGSRSKAQIKAFEDTWRWDMGAAEAFQEIVENGPQRVSQVMQSFRRFLGESDMLAYLSMMAPRLVEMRRVLKSTGSIYLHCDPTASHHLKVLMDAIFGAANFRNEIIWHYKFRMMYSQRIFNRKHDILLFFAKSPSAKIRMSAVAETWTREEIIKTRKQAIYEDESGKEWIWMPGPRGRSKSKKKYLDDIIAEGKALDDVWDIPVITSSAKERLGYPTQKPEALLERIVKASSDEDDIVMDPFCGCGTAIAVAQHLKRRWIGIDITHLAITLIKHRLQDAFGKNVKYNVIGEPVSLPDAETLAKADPYQFQWWALGLVGARPTEEKKGADKGIDGRIYFHDEAKGGKTKQIILQVKAGHATAAQIRDLRGVLDRENAQIGVFITLQSPTQPMRKEAASAGFYESPGWGTKHPRLQISTVEELLEGKQISYPAPKSTSRTYKKAPKAKGGQDTQQNFLKESTRKGNEDE
jgi:DNA modification methylase